MKFVQTTLLSLLLLAAPTFAQESAYGGVAADAASTALGLANGLTEANPLGLATIPLRMAATAYASKLPDHAGQPVVDAVKSVSWGAAASNLLVIFGVGPLAPVVGIALAVSLWQQNAPERDFYAACRRHKALAPDTSQLPCVKT